jgi:hypothetical protein
MEIPRCTAIGFLENLQIDTFNENNVADEKKMEEEVSMDKPIPNAMTNDEKENFLEKVKISVRAKEHETYNFFVKTP